MLTDIAARKQAEEELVKIQNLEAPSLLASTIGLNFNNIFHVDHTTKLYRSSRILALEPHIKKRFSGVCMTLGDAREGTEIRSLVPSIERSVTWESKSVAFLGLSF